MKTKKIKAWYVHYDLSGDEFSGDVFRNQARIYKTKKIALKHWPKTFTRTILPCTITYKIQ